MAIQVPIPPAIGTGTARVRQKVPGAVLNLVASVFSQASTLIVTLFIARRLSLSEFGQFAFAYSTLITVGTLVGTTLATTGTKYVAEYLVTARERVGRTVAILEAIGALIGMGVVLLLFLLAASPLFASLWSEDVGRLVALCSPFVVFAIVQQVHVGILGGFEAFNLAAAAQVVRFAITIPVVVVSVQIGGVRGVAVGFILASLCASGCSLYVLNRLLRTCGLSRDIRGASSEFRDLRMFAAGTGVGNMLVTPVLWATTAILAAQLNGLREVALYHAASQWRVLAGFVPAVLAQWGLPALCRQRSQTGTTWSFRFFLSLIGGSVVIVMPLVLALATFPQLWMGVFGHQFKVGARLLEISAWTGVLVGVNNILGVGLASLDRVWWAVASNAFWAVTCVAGSWVLAPQQQALGVVQAVLISYAVHLATQTVLLARAYQEAKRKQSKV